MAKNTTKHGKSPRLLHFFEILFVKVRESLLYQYFQAFLCKKNIFFPTEMKKILIMLTLFRISQVQQLNSIGSGVGIKGLAAIAEKNVTNKTFISVF